ncbi:MULTISPECIES: ABC transporter substrate-binding protein [Cyanophyceae]|uniref:ABC transporter substrate-binding protein n=1 Tax=Cyanophyceae TaxID=3028117 RepID=UPI00232FDC93|nr:MULTISPECIES: ABC transporter substrate-binding protein [Cyanophyceae]MDB9356212.1 ABC transporter substrate-binding protein [Nodularia spumigena CS-587/03]MDB9305145.1 ABC transporter substrate-binding protein [Nodularia spumigena CS-591/12]MDB9339697.1 ABC transporter substrate-binding protein [Nodularia spumigena CS-589/07]MDB9345901.1 ABC transporter substrate-binding protein [Nodularia spumigena CS-588/06]MDB9370336.1 ABC transporter substrate-binding protein [Nodularia spumigena CS-58
MPKIYPALGLSIVTLATSLLLGACDNANTTTDTNPGNTTAGNTTDSSQGLKIGSLLPATGDLASIGQQMSGSVPLLVETVNACEGVNGKPVTLVQVDDQTDPRAGAAGMTKLATLDKVAGVVGSFASSVSTAAVSVAVPNQVMMVSPGSTSPVFTEKAQKGDFKSFWARTAPPDTYQALALAQLANQKGFKRVSTVVINNDYGVGFEKAFIEAFEKLGGTVINKDQPVRYDPKAQTFDTEAAAAFADKPDAVIAVLYAETGSLLLKTAYERGLTEGVQILLTDGVKAPTFPDQVGKGADGKYLLAGALGTVPGSDGKALADFNKLWQEKKGGSPGEYAPQAWDAAALLVLAAQAAQENTGVGISNKIREVSNEPGTEVTDVCEGLKLLREGQDINYQGASGNVDVDANGDVVGVYDVWDVAADGKIQVIDKVSPQPQ